MKILFLHLSDMHLRDSEKYLDSRATSIIKAISANIKFDDAAILVTGDISQSGKTNEYKVAGKFFGALIRKFIEKYKVRPKVYVVPGNHDINFEEKSRTKEQVVTLLNNGITDSEINEEAKKIENFCKFANFNDCFVLNKEIDIKTLNFNGYLIQLNLINSSMFSTFKDKPGENDLGIHYLSEEAIMSLKRKENVVFSMTLMHHADEYFSSQTRMELSSAITDVSDVLLLGHDHFFDEYSVSRNKHGATEIIKGGKFNDCSSLESAFAAVLLDTDLHTISIYGFEWQNGDHFYALCSNQEQQIKKGIENNDSFKSWLTASDTNLVSKNYLDYFEFPRLSIKSDDETVPDSRKEILNLDSYMLQTKINHIVEISGGELSGKTVLLKYLYSQYKNTHTPLMINEEDAATQIDRTIKNAYERQYTKDPMSYQAFQQMKKSEKIIFIDNIDVFAEKCKKPILMYLIERFSKVVYSTNLSHELNAIKILEDIIDNEELKIIKLKIEPYYIDKRTSLIRKVCKCVRDYDSEQQLEDAVEEVNKFIKNQLKVFSLNPEFIIMFTKSYILKMVESSNANAFNVVFSNNISVAIEKHRIKTNDKDNLIILQELAYYIHFNKKYPLNFACFQSIVEDYNQLHRTKNSAITILEELSNAKILKRNGDEVSFYNKTYLAYFVAKWINRKIHNGEGHNELNFVIKNICYNINSDILLFLTYLVENVGALMDILQEEREFTNGMREFSLDKNIFTLLTQGVEELYDIAVPKNADRDMQKEKEIKIERQLIESEEIEIVNIYDENLDDFIAQQMKLFKFQEILCKILPGFYHLLTSQQQDQFVREIYKLPNKVLYCLFKSLEDNKKELLEELEGFLDSTNNTKYNNKESVKKLLSNIMSAMLLSLYEMTAVLASDEATIDALDAFNYKSDSSYFVQNIMMHENLKKFGDYIARSDELFDNTKSIYTKNLLRWIFKKHCLKNNISYKKEGQKYIDKYLGSQNIIGLKLGYTKKD